MAGGELIVQIMLTGITAFGVMTETFVIALIIAENAKDGVKTGVQILV